MLRRCVWSRNIKNGCSIYIYDISHLRVNITHVSFSISQHREPHRLGWLAFYALAWWISNTSIPRWSSFLLCVRCWIHPNLLHSLCTKVILLFWTGQLLSACVTFEFVDSYVKWRCHLLISFCIYMKLCNNKCNSFILVSHFLDLFAKLRKVTISFVLPVRLSVRTEQLDSHWTGFRKILYMSTERKCAKKIQVSLKSDKNNGYITWRPVHIFYHISLIWNKNQLMSLFQFYLYIAGSLHVSGPQAHP